MDHSRRFTMLLHPQCRLACVVPVTRISTTAPLLLIGPRPPLALQMQPQWHLLTWSIHHLAWLTIGCVPLRLFRTLTLPLILWLDGRITRSRLPLRLELVLLPYNTTGTLAMGQLALGRLWSIPMRMLALTPLPWPPATTVENTQTA